MAAAGGSKRKLTITDADTPDGFLTKLTSAVSESPVVNRTKSAASDAAHVAGRLAKSTGKAAWIVGTTLLVLVVPLIIEMDREQQFNDLDLQQATLLGTPAAVV